LAEELYELIPKLESLHALCHERGITLDPEPGSRMLYKGQVYYVIAAKGNALVLVDDFPSIPFDMNRVITIENWEEQENCLFVPSVEDLLHLIREATSLFPSMTPGVKKTREVWQVRHTEGSTVVTGSLREGLLDIAIEKLEERES